MDQLHLLTLKLKMAVTRASETLAIQPNAKDEKKPPKKQR
jgi:hypothetical protein